MESILKIIGTEIWISSFLFSSGLEGSAYSTKLREAEALACLMQEQYDKGFEAGETEGYKSGELETRNELAPFTT